MEILPWLSARARPHPQGGRAGLPPDGPVEGSAPRDPDGFEGPGTPDDPRVVAAWRAAQAVTTAPPSAAELAGLGEALTQFRAVVPMSTVQASHEGRRRMTSAGLGSRLGVAAAGVLLLSFGGVGAFALSGSHSAGNKEAVPLAGPTTGPARGAVTSAVSTAPTTDDDSGKAKEKQGGAPKTAVGPDATGPAAFGLCTAWSHAKPSKQTATHSVAFRNLVAAAGGAERVEAYCMSVQHPSPGKRHEPSHDPKGRPTNRPDRGGAAHPTDKPSTSLGQGSTASPTSRN